LAIPILGIDSSPMGVPTRGSAVVGATWFEGAGTVAVVEVDDPGVVDVGDVVVVAGRWSLPASSWRRWDWALCS